MIRKLGFLLFSLLTCISCKKDEVTSDKGGASKEIRIGVTVGPHLQVMEFVKRKLQVEGIQLKIVEFNDFILPNQSLDQGELDANCYQHEPFLNEQIKTRGYKIKSIAKTLLMPMGIYSLKFKSLQEIGQDQTIAIPNDPTNGGRALLLLEKQGFITLKNHDNPSVRDIEQNSKNLVIKEVEAPSIPRVIKDVDFAIINTDWVLMAKMDPKTALAREDQNSPYTNLLVSQSESKKKEVIAQLVKAYQSQETKEFVEKTFNGAVVVGW